MWFKEHVAFPALTFQRHTGMVRLLPTLHVHVLILSPIPVLANVLYNTYNASYGKHACVHIPLTLPHHVQQPVSLIFAATAVAGGRTHGVSSAAATVLLPRTVAVTHPDDAPAALRVLRLPEDIYHSISIRRGILDVYAATPASLLAQASEAAPGAADHANALSDLPDFIQLESPALEAPAAAATAVTDQFPWSMQPHDASPRDETFASESNSSGPPAKRRRGSYGEEFRLFCSELPRFGSELPGYSSGSGSGGGGTCFDLVPPLSVALSGSPSSLESAYTREGGSLQDHMRGGGSGGVAAAAGAACMAGVRGFVKRQLAEQDPDGRQVYTRLYNGHCGVPGANQSSCAQRPAERDQAALWPASSLDDSANVHVGLTSLLCEQMLTDLDGADPCGGLLQFGL